MIDDAAIVDAVVRDFPDTAVVYRFGSTAAGTAGRGSDIDIAFLASGPVDPVRRFEVQERLAARLRQDVDLVDLCSASTVLRMQVLAGGTPIGVIDEARRGQFEDLVFATYPRLNEERRDILSDIRERGRVYGG